jgi:alpha-glucosidase
VLAKGALEVHEAREGYISLIRAFEGQRMLCAFNLHDTAEPLNLPEGDWGAVGDTPFKINNIPTELAPFRAWFGVLRG